MRLYEVISALTFKIESHGFHHGQQDLKLVASRNGEYVGHIDYSVYQDEPYVQYISVPVEKHQGIGTAMVRRLQAEYPDTEINMGTLTPDGSKLLASIPQTIIPDPDYAAKTKRYEELQARLAEYNRIADEFHSNPTPENREKVSVITHDWNDLTDEMDLIADNIRDRRPHKRLFR